MDLPGFLACPTCRAELRDAGGKVVCAGGHAFPEADGFIDFTEGPSADEQWQELHQHAVEASGIEHRMTHFLLPHIRREFGHEKVRLLDDGTGLGHVVDFLTRHSDVDAYGVDPGCRRREWGALGLDGRLFGADGLALPFADESFDVVFSSGVLEHVGDPLPPGKDREQPMHGYIGEVVRVLCPGGVAWIAHPNGRHPIDYWHPLKHSLRPHSPWQRWMPQPAEVRRAVAASPIPAWGRFVPPAGFLAFERVKEHAYGRAFTGVMRGVFRLTEASPRLFAGSWLNPWLVTEIRRA